MIALLALAAAHACPVPRVAYETERTLSKAEYRKLERFGACVCGTDGYNDFSISPGTDVDYDVYRDPRESRYRFHPSCDREQVGYRGFHPRRQVPGHGERG